VTLRMHANVVGNNSARVTAWAIRIRARFAGG
jgi:hypothetical protein